MSIFYNLSRPPVTAPFCQVKKLSAEIPVLRVAMAAVVADLNEFEKDKEYLKTTRPLRERMVWLEQYTENLLKAVRSRDDQAVF